MNYADIYYNINMDKIVNYTHFYIQWTINQMAQSIRAFALQAEGWVSESQPRQFQVV